MNHTQTETDMAVFVGKPISSLTLVVHKKRIWDFREILSGCEPLKRLLRNVSTNDHNFPFISLPGGNHNPDGTQRIEKALEENGMSGVDQSNFQGFQLRYMAEDHRLVIQALESIGIKGFM